MEAIGVVAELNDKIFEAHPENRGDLYFSYETDGYNEAITFCEHVIWTSEDFVEGASYELIKELWLDWRNQLNKIEL